MPMSRHFEFGDALLLFDAGVEAAAVGQFHHQIALAIQFVEGVDVNDVGVVERGAGAGFADKNSPARQDRSPIPCA